MIQTLTTIAAYTIAVTGFLIICSVLIGLAYICVEKVIRKTLDHFGLYHVFLEFAFDRAKKRQLRKEKKSSTHPNT